MRVSARLATLSLAAALLASVAPARGADSAAVTPLMLDQIFADDASGRRPGAYAWSPDGRRLAYTWDAGEGVALWVGTIGEVGPLRLLSLDALPGEVEAGEVRSLDALVWAPGSDALLAVWRQDLFLVPLAGELRRLTATASEEKQPAFSPEGRSLAFVRDANLVLLDLASGRERPLTSDGKPDAILNGTNDWLYWEELWNRRDAGFWWSLDGRRIAYYRFDEDGVETYPLLDERPVYPEVRWQRYPKAGTTNPGVRLGVLDVASGRTTWLATGEETRDTYLPRVAWTPDGAVAVERLSRDQRRLDLLRCDATDGACTTLLSETSPAWIIVGDDVRFLADGRFLRVSEASGWRRLALHAADGRELRVLGPAAGALVSLDGVDEAAGIAIATVHGPPPLGAAQRQVVAIGLADGRVGPLATAAGWNTALVAPQGGRWVHTWSDSATPPFDVVRDGAGRLLVELPYAPPAGYDPARLPQWELRTIPAPAAASIAAAAAALLGVPSADLPAALTADLPTELPAAILRPAAFEPAARYPALMYHYGGPGSQVVQNRWGNTRGLWHAMMAQRGYVLLMVDNAASAAFGKLGEDRVRGCFGPIELPAQQAGVAFLGSLGFVDTARIGIWGWSGGGSHTLDALFRSPGTWRAGVAGAPVTDWRLYDTVWAERYLGRPQDNVAGYERCQPLAHAGTLADALLLVHGTADDNVHPQNTTLLVDRLVAAGKPHELALYPNEDHGLDDAASRHFYARMAEFFDRHLRPGR